MFMIKLVFRDAVSFLSVLVGGGSLVSMVTSSGWPHSSQDKIPCVFPVLDNFSLYYFYVINSS